MHVLDWTSHSEFLPQFAELVSLPECGVGHSPVWWPRGRKEPREARLERDGSEFLPSVEWKDLSVWWLRHRRGANTPNWDLVVTCVFGGIPGLALVEAKAHEGELDWGGKPDPGGFANSAENHARIGQAIAEASSALDRVVSGVRLSRDSHYQLANRVACSWKVASMGVPVLLVYLGFIGDDGIADVGPPLKSHDHWQSVMRTYTADVLPEGFCDRWLPCGKAEMRMVIRSRPVLRQSPSVGT